MLTGPQRRLVELLQHINFGQVHNLQVRNGEPVLEPAPRVIRKLRLGGDNSPRGEASQEDFLLKQSVIEMLGTISSIGDGHIPRIEVAHGLPLFVEIEYDPAGFAGGNDAKS